MGKALYRKYRSKSLSEIVGQEHITTTLSNALKKGSVSHAYLFTGPRGVGKTSIARILAYEVNNIPYDESTTQLDIIEIDAASNRRIDEIRDLKERVAIAPTSSKYKVYIIDEVHMLTKEAFNALLKTLEEPPAHVIFILATTEAHKVPQTIISRTQRLTFKPVTMDKVMNHLKYIAKQENIIIADDALDLIARHGEGSFRDSISVLDQVQHINDKNITLQDVRQALGEAPNELLHDLITGISSKNTKAVADALDELRSFGVQAPQVAKQLAKLIRDDIIGQAANLDPAVALKLLHGLLEVPSANNPDLSLELCLFATTVVYNQPETVIDSRKTPDAPSEPKPMAAKPQIKATKPQQPKAPVIEQVPGKTPQKPSKEPKNGSRTLTKEDWQNVLGAIKSKHNTLYGIARMAVPSFEGQTITLAFGFPFHQKRLNDTKNKQLLLDIIFETTGVNASLDCIVEKEVANKVSVPKPEISAVEPDDLEAISNIFGAAEVIE